MKCPICKGKLYRTFVAWICEECGYDKPIKNLTREFLDKRA